MPLLLRWILLVCWCNKVLCRQEGLEMSMVKSDSGSELSLEAMAEEPVVEPKVKPARRIYNADINRIKIEDYPFMVAILMNGHLWCGGVLIETDTVLTAAHCLQLQYNNRFFREYMKMLTVRVGSSNATHGGEVVGIGEIFFHPNYVPKTLAFNAAVLKLTRNLTLNVDDDEERKVNLIKYDYRGKFLPINKMISFLGWGSAMPEITQGGLVLLQKVDLPVYHLRDCQEVYGTDLVTRSNFCAGYITVRKNVCNHDAGGPAIMEGKLVGILSFSHKRCDELDKPAVFLALASIRPWLNNIKNRVKFDFMID